jgi:CheY-like chemotaxis protein
MNLVVNARDATADGGRITVETAAYEMDRGAAQWRFGVQPGSYVVLMVSDSGCGMDAGTQAHIFEPFFTTKEAGKGTGLGLSTVYGIVKGFGGDIQVYSEPGRGTTFKVYLPQALEARGALTRPETSGPLPRGSETILLVEDEDGVRAVARETLRECGYTVLEARHAGEALTLSEGFHAPIHLMISDLVMPAMSGNELALRLRGSRAEMKVLLVSGFTEKTLPEAGLAGAGFLQKPFTPDVLALRVREVLERERSAAA